MTTPSPLTAPTAPTRRRRTVMPPTPVPASAPDTMPAVAKFPHYPPRADTMNTRHLHDHAAQPALRLHLGNPDTTIVLGELPLSRDVPRGRAGVRIPDLLIAFNIRRAHILEQDGYAISEQGKPPDFVLEVASDSTSRIDETLKWQDYAAFGVTEYWLFDPDWGKRYRQGLIGWVLVDGSYRPIPIYEYAPGMHYGYSAVLGLYLCWEHGRLRWYDPAAGYLRTHDETDRALHEERSARIVLQTQRDEEREARIAEREVRIIAQAEIERLREENARLRAAQDATQ